MNNNSKKFLRNDLLSSSFSQESSNLLFDKKRIKSGSSFESSELDSRQELAFHSIGTCSDNSYIHELNEKKENLILNLKDSKRGSKTLSDKTQNSISKGHSFSFVLNNIENQKNFQKDETIVGNRSNSYIPQVDDSLSTLSDKKKKIIVRIVTIFSIIFFLICFAMIAFTLRMSEKIDAQIRKGYMEYNFNTLSKSTKTMDQYILSESFPLNLTKSIHKLKKFDSNRDLTKANYFVNNVFTRKIFTLRSNSEFNSD